MYCNQSTVSVRVANFLTFNITGTNLNVRQRLALFFMYLCTLMFANGIFYGREQSTVAQDILASFIVSLCGTAPVTVIRVLFLNAKPRSNTSTKSPKVQFLSYRSKNDDEHSPKKTKTGEVKSEVKIQDARDMWEKMYNGMYPLPPFFREIAWASLLLVSAVACCLAVCPP